MSGRGQGAADAYARRIDQERRHYDGVLEFDDLSAIYHYWSHTYVRPMLETLGCSHPRDVFARYLFESAGRTGAAKPRFLSVGSGDANNEIVVARSLIERGLSDFTIECVEMNPALVARARRAAKSAGLARHLAFVRADFNQWRPSRLYDGIMANQSLHHATNLEGLFQAIADALAPHALFAVSDIVGRNGHQRWPEARYVVDRFWQELPQAYRRHRQLGHCEERFVDWDCSSEGFEGIRSQEVLPLLIERFFFHVFVGFGSAVDPFVDRGFGPNFDAAAAWDRDFIDRVDACDEAGLHAGLLTPTHAVAVLANEPHASPYYSRGLSPERAVRHPEKPFGEAEIEALNAIVETWGRPRGDTQPSIRGSARIAGEARGLYNDDWAGRTLEFAVVPARTIRTVTLYVSLPPGAPAGDVVLEIDGERAAAMPSAPNLTLRCERSLPAGSPVALRLIAPGTVVPHDAGLGDDVRELGIRLRAALFEP